MEIKIEFKGATAYIDIGNSDISGEYVVSPNGQYFMLCNTLFTPSGNDREYAIVFSKDNVVYKKAIPGDSGCLARYVFDDASSLVLTDECDLLCYDPSGKQVKKALGIEPEQHGFVGDVFYIIGSNEDGNTTLFCYDRQSNKSSKVVIPDIEYADEEKEDQLSSDVEYLHIGNRFVFLYENATDAVAYDLNCRQTALNPSDIGAVKQARIQRKMERESAKMKQEPACAASLEDEELSAELAKKSQKARNILIGIAIVVFIILIIMGNSPE